MRFLCLHGHGTNSRILETQLELLRTELPHNWEFEFLDGDQEAVPAKGKAPSISNVDQSHRHAITK